MKFLEIKSKGEMQLEAISLIGASTKRGDNNSIGMFGSGLKYGICAMLRQDIPFMIFSGENEIKISVKEVEFGAKKFNQVYVNGEATSLTDSMGTEDWQGVFPFIREIYSNALDEDEFATINIVNDLKIQAGHTTFYINATEEILQLIKHFDGYFCDSSRNLAMHDSYGEIHKPHEHLKIFRKGILSYEDVNEKSIFSYNLFNITINESRVVRNLYEVRNEVAKLIERCEDVRLLERWINGIDGGDHGYFEHECFAEPWWTQADNPVFVDFIASHKYYPIILRDEIDENDKKDRLGLPLKLLRRFLAYAPDIDVLGLNTSKNGETINFIEKTPSTILWELTQDAIHRLKDTRYNSRLTANVKWCAFKDTHTLGWADSKNNTIWLSTKLDVYTIDEIAKIIIEEQEHLLSGFDDETRAFQNHLFNLYFNQLTQKTR